MRARRKGARPLGARDGLLPFWCIGTIEVESGPCVFHRVQLAILYATTHEMPAQGLETDCLVGRLKGILEGVVQRNVPCSCARSSSGDEMVTVRDRASAIYYKHARDSVSTRRLRGILTDGRMGESEDRQVVPDGMADEDLSPDGFGD